jgi:hypothetical protein
MEARNDAEMEVRDGGAEFGCADGLATYVGKVSEPDAARVRQAYQFLTGLDHWPVTGGGLFCLFADYCAPGARFVATEDGMVAALCAGRWRAFVAHAQIAGALPVVALPELDAVSAWLAAAPRGVRFDTRVAVCAAQQLDPSVLLRGISVGEATSEALDCGCLGGWEALLETSGLARWTEVQHGLWEARAAAEAKGLHAQCW